MRRRSRKAQRGSALLSVMVFVLLIAIGIGTMLSSVRYLSRATNDRMAFEEARHTAMAGVTMTKAWLMNPALAKNHLGSEVGGKLEKITSGAINLSNYIRGNDTNLNLLTGLSSAEILTQFFAPWDGAFSAGSCRSLGDSRQVIYEWPSTPGSVITLYNDSVKPQFTGSLFSAASSGKRSYVEKIRITTPFRQSGTSKAGIYVQDDLRRVSVIIEAQAVSYSTGQPKRRIVQEKLLIVPGVDKKNGPVVAPSAGAAFGGNTIAVNGNSSLNIHWGQVWSKGDVQLLDLTMNASGTIKILNAADKFIGAGTTGGDKWVRWQTGGVLTTTDGVTPILGRTINGVQVTDFFAQVLNGDFGPDWTKDKVQLVNDFLWKNSPGQWASSSTGEGILYEPIRDGGRYPIGNGALVQQSSEIAAMVDRLVTTQLNYDAWKSYSIANNWYIRPTNNGNFVNSTGQTLYVSSQKTLTTSSSGGAKQLTDLSQITMAIPANGNTNLIPDRPLFIDTVDGTQNGAKASVNIPSSFFWKGIIFANCNIKTTGVSAGQKVLMKNPDEFNQDPTGNSTGALYPSCYLDGVLHATGTLSRTGNGCIYGCLITGKDYTGGGGPDIYYNSRLRYGTFREPVTGKIGSQELSQIMTGPIVEIDAWL